MKPVLIGIILVLGLGAFAQNSEKALARAYSEKGYELLQDKGDAGSSRFFAQTALEYYSADPLALFIMSKTEPNDWNLALEKAQEALRVYENLIINSSAPAGGSKPLFQDELVTWIGSLLYRLGRYDDYQGLEESFPKVMLRAENLWQGVRLRQNLSITPIPLLRAALDLYPFDADIALQALPYEEELGIQDRIDFLELKDVNTELFPMILAARSFHRNPSRVMDVLREMGWEDPRMDSALALDFPDAAVPPRWTGEWQYDLLLYSRRLLTNLPQDYISAIDVNQDQIIDQWLIFDDDQLVFWLQDWDQNWVVTAKKVQSLLDGESIYPQIDLAMTWKDGELQSITESQLGSNESTQGVLSFDPYPFVSYFDVHRDTHSLRLFFPPQKLAQKVLSDQPHLIPPLFVPQYFDETALVMDQQALFDSRVKLEERREYSLIRSDWVFRGQILERFEDLSGRGFFDARIEYSSGQPNKLYLDLDGDGVFEVQGQYDNGRLISLYSDTDKNLVTEYGQVYINSRVEYWDLDQDGDIEFRLLSDPWGLTRSYRYPFSSFSEKETPDW